MKPTTTKDEIRAIMNNGDWHSIREISEKLHYTRGYIKVLLGQMWLKRELKRIHPSRGTTRTLYILASAKKAREYEDGQRVY